MLKHFIALKKYSRQEIISLLSLTHRVKKTPYRYAKKLTGKRIGLLFQKPSLRTKASFYLGSTMLGATPLYFSPQEVQIGKRESVRDVARTISRYFDCIVLRTFEHQTITDFIEHSQVPVVNALSQLLHPSQVLGDIFTLDELKKDIKKMKFAYMGDGNNVCHSLLYAFAILGGHIWIAHPKHYAPDKKIVSEVQAIARKNKATIHIGNDPRVASRGADVLYTDVWTSMGNEDERAKRVKIFQPFQLNEKLLGLAKKNCIIMHCLPAHRGEEITDKVIDSKHSRVFLQAENRLHTAKAILLSLLSK